jgi:Bacterial Ig-like domain (group 2)
VASNAKGFLVPVPGGNTLVPDVVTMMVGDTRRLQAAGQPATGLTWTSSDPAKVSLSTEDPPVLTALATGHVTITAGTATTDVTVIDAGTLPGGTPPGTVLWSNPGNGSGVTKIVPAVPSPTGVADVFAFQADGTVQAITADGTTAWTADVSAALWAGAVVPDFQGGLVGLDWSNGYGSIWKLDGITGQRSSLYTPPESWVMGSPFAVHTDGTIFATVIDDADDIWKYSLVGLNPTGGQKFILPLEAEAYGLIIAGDGYAYTCPA